MASWSAIPSSPTALKLSQRLRRRPFVIPWKAWNEAESAHRFPGESVLPGLELVACARPILFEQAGHGAIRQEAAAGLAAAAVVRFVAGIDDPLYRGAADGTGLAVAAVDRHAFTERRHLLG